MLGVLLQKLSFKHKFKNTYRYGAYFTINEVSIVLEVENVSKDIFHNYLMQLSQHKPRELKIVVMDNAGFHSTKGIEIPNNIRRLRIPPHIPELNPCEIVVNELIRPYIPKNTDFSTLKNQYITEIQNQLNNRPRKRYNYQTPIFEMQKLLFNLLSI